MIEIERFVDATKAAEFLGLNRRRVLEMARAGEIPAHPLGKGRRRTWRFRLTELAQAIAGTKPCTIKPQEGSIEFGSPRQSDRRK